MYVCAGLRGDMCLSACLVTSGALLDNVRVVSAVGMCRDEFLHDSPCDLVHRGEKRE